MSEDSIDDLINEAKKLKKRLDIEAAEIDYCLRYLEKYKKDREEEEGAIEFIK